MKQEISDIIFIQETKCSIQKLRQIHSKWLGRFEFLEVKAENTAGGILTLWNPQKIGILDVEASSNYLSVVIQPVGDRQTFLVTNIYGPQRIDDKLRFLDSLVDLRDTHADTPWIMGGDFNMIKSLSEKKWGTRALSKDIVAFQTFSYNMNLVDTNRNTGLFTWNNKRGGESHVASKLDRFIISEDLMLIDKEVTTRFLPFGGLDHWPVQLEIKGIGTPRNKPFRFENIWLSHPDFITNIEKWWAEDLQMQGTRMYLLHKRLKHIKLQLKEWNKKNFGNIFVEKKDVENKMQVLNQALIMEGFDKAIGDQVDKHHQDWENLCKQEEIFWRQKSRVQWLKEGERNTKFFHRAAIANRTHNRISSIKNEEGELHISHEAIEVVLVQHFQGITQKNNSDREHFIREITSNIPKLVSREDNFNLNRPVMEEEVEHNHFEVLNTSFISLIPKQDNAQTPDKFRPISLCNVVYKIISKVVANRLKPLLPVLVSGEQSGYVEGRQILDNIIQAQEVVHSLTSKRQTSMIMLLDIAKAYDKVNRTYIKKTLIAFGFDHN
eukprot:PITA_30821